MSSNICRVSSALCAGRLPHISRRRFILYSTTISLFWHTAFMPKPVRGNPGLIALTAFLVYGLQKTIDNWPDIKQFFYDLGLSPGPWENRIQNWMDKDNRPHAIIVTVNQDPKPREFSFDYYRSSPIERHVSNRDILTDLALNNTMDNQSPDVPFELRGKYVDFFAIFGDALPPETFYATLARGKDLASGTMQEDVALMEAFHRTA